MLVILNILSLTFLLVAVYFAKKKNFKLHKIFISICMVFSIWLLYVFIKMRVEYFSSKNGTMQAALEKYSQPVLWFGVSHVVAAMVTFLMAFVVIYFALNNKLRPKFHKKWARVLYPIWVYTCVTGIIIFAYLQIYH